MSEQSKENEMEENKEQRSVVHLFRSFPQLAETARQLTKSGFFETYNVATCVALGKDGTRHVLRKVMSEDDCLAVCAHRPDEIIIHGGTNEHTGRALAYMRCDKSKVTALFE